MVELKLSSEFFCAPLPPPPPPPAQPALPNWKKRSVPPVIKSSSSPSPSPSPEEPTLIPGLLKQLGHSLWGKGLPPGALIGAVRSAWAGGWAVMMNQMAPRDARGGYVRPPSKFRGRPPREISPSDHGRYHLYVSLTCPWAHRAALVHSLKGLGDSIPLSIVVPSPNGMWVFDPCPKDEDAGAGAGDSSRALSPTLDRAHSQRRLINVYKLRHGGYDGRATVPMLWDSARREVVSNESADIVEILNAGFDRFALNPHLDLAPLHLRSEIEKWNGIIYANVNNGVYRCGFAQEQDAYREAVEDLFSTLDMLEGHLASSRYLCGNDVTLADIRLFTTLYRFDPVYHILFKCSKRKISEYPNLYGYLKDMYQIPGVAATCDLNTIMDGYYKVLFPLNPGGISPAIPFGSDSASLNTPHHRESISSTARASSLP